MIIVSIIVNDNDDEDLGPAARQEKIKDGKRKAEVLLHPVRMRIIAELSAAPLTTKGLSTALPDVPQATLYRHLTQLRDSGVIQVAAESVVNGATERTYRVISDHTRISPEEALSITGEEHQKHFLVFVGALLASLKRFVARRSSAAIARSGLSYSRVELHLSAAERSAFQREHAELMSRYTKLGTKGRIRFSFAVIVVPSAGPKA